MYCILQRVSETIDYISTRDLPPKMVTTIQNHLHRIYLFIMDRSRSISKEEEESTKFE
jgi:hypothetical protein